MTQEDYYKDALLIDYPEIESNELVCFNQTDIKIYIPEKEAYLRFFFRNVSYGEKTLGYHPSPKLIQWLREYVGNDNWKYDNEHWIPEEVGYYYFGAFVDISYGFDFCRPFLSFTSLEHAILFKLTW